VVKPAGLRDSGRRSDRYSFPLELPAASPELLGSSPLLPSCARRLRQKNMAPAIADPISASLRTTFPLAIRVPQSRPLHPPDCHNRIERPGHGPISVVRGERRRRACTERVLRCVG
jgi:hypothetical protein